MKNHPNLSLTACCVCTSAFVLLEGCSGFGRSVPAPVEERMGSKSKPVVSVTQPKPSLPVATPPSDSTKTVIPAIESSSRSGFYTVKPGDTLIRIGLDHGQNWRDIIRWNNIENPNVIEVGQVLRIAPPSADTNQDVAVSKAIQLGNVSPHIDEKKNQPMVETPPVTSIKSEGLDDSFQLIWPAIGTVSSTFDDSKNKGIDISGKTGDAVLAAADGKVVYAGSGLRGYGNLVILKHNNTFLTAYAHNQTLLVREDQSVKRGQKIAEMGSSDSELVKLHFEVRRLGKPIDPLKFLPTR
jgi:lipoprotein NlpD